MPLVTITPRSAPDEGSLARQLESGAILSFVDGSIALGAADLEVLRRQNPSHSRFHKNIAYRPDSGRLGGAGGIPRRDREPIRHALATFARGRSRGRDAFPAIRPILADRLHEFSPLRGSGRPLRTTSRNDLMHVDAFPSRPDERRPDSAFLHQRPPEPPSRVDIRRKLRAARGACGPFGFWRWSPRRVRKIALAAPDFRQTTREGARLTTSSCRASATFSEERRLSEERVAGGVLLSARRDVDGLHGRSQPRGPVRTACPRADVPDLPRQPREPGERPSPSSKGWRAAGG